MVKFLLLTLAFALAHAEDEVSGDWRTVAIASSDHNKIIPGGPMRLYDRHLQCLEGCEVLAFTFYVHLNEDCQKITVFSKHIGNGIYKAQYEGENTLRLEAHSDEFLVYYNENVDKEGNLSRMLYFLGKRPLNAEEELRLVEFAKSKGIPAENIEHVLATDVCPQ